MYSDGIYTRWRPPQYSLKLLHNLTNYAMVHIPPDTRRRSTSINAKQKKMGGSNNFKLYSAISIIYIIIG